MNTDNSRIAYFDNLKFVLICLVVIAHGFANHIGENANLPSVFVFINTFHMPLFIFVSGLFYSCKNISQRIILLVTYGLYFKGLIWLNDGILGHTWGKFELFKEESMPWFLFVLAVWEGFAYIVRKMNPKFVLTGAVIVGCLAGHDAMVTGSEFFSRMIVWFPFFYMGVLVDREKLTAFMEEKKPTHSALLKIICMILMFLYAAICIVRRADIWNLMGLIIPRTLFADMPFKCTLLTRLIYYVGVSALGIGFMSIIPTVNIGWGGITKWGKRTLQVYIYHIFIRNILDKNSWSRNLCSTNLHILLYIMINILIVIVLSQKIFSIPTDYIKENIFQKN